jgi:ABC-type Zn2+ transport system substrate-binding protein/surface adhesin
MSTFYEEFEHDKNGATSWHEWIQDKAEELAAQVDDLRALAATAQERALRFADENERLRADNANLRAQIDAKLDALLYPGKAPEPTE